MNIKKAAEAYRTLSVGFAELADACLDELIESGAVHAPEQPVQEERLGATLTPAPAQPEGHLAICPKHRVEYRPGKFGPFCPKPTDDPAWADKKGFCRITPATAAEWLRMQAA